MRDRRVLMLGFLLLAIIVIILLFVLVLPSRIVPGRPAPGETATSQPTAGTNVYPANIDYEGITNYGNYTPAVLTNPNIGAVDISMNWSQVEPQQGVFNWTPADKVMADWSARGKKFTLIIRYVKELENPISCNSSQQFLPQWEIPRTKTICDSDMGILFPDYFDATFKADLKAYVEAIARHIAQSPYKNNLLYVRAAVGAGGEGFPFFRRGDFQTILSQMEGFGYSPAAWATWQKEMMTAYKQAFSYTTVIYPVNAIGTDPTTGQPVHVENSEWAAAQGMGIGQQGLLPTTNYEIFQQLRTRYPKMYIQFQTGYSSGNADVSGDVQAAEKNGAQFVEWFTADILKSSNQSAFAQWQQYVDNKFGEMTATASTSPPHTLTSMPLLALTSTLLTSLASLCKSGYVILPSLPIPRNTSLRFPTYRKSKLFVNLPTCLSESYPLKKCALLWLFAFKEQCYSSCSF